jgi:FAD synthase
MTILSGNVVRGFGRGSKQLGFPTANLESAEISDYIAQSSTGIYAGFAKVDGYGFFPAAISVGWNPTFNDVKHKVFEAHIIHEFTHDFYGCNVDIRVIEKIRDEKKFDSLDDLIDAIRDDCDKTYLICKKSIGLLADSHL